MEIPNKLEICSKIYFKYTAIRLNIFLIYNFMYFKYETKYILLNIYLYTSCNNYILSIKLNTFSIMFQIYSFK